MDLVSATRAFREARKIADAAWEDVLDAGQRLMDANNDYDRVRAAREERAAILAYEKAKESAREARRRMTDMKAGLAIQ